MPKWQSRSLAFACGLIASLALMLPARAVINLFPPGQNWNAGTDGAFAPTSNVEIDLAQAPTANWDTASSQPGKGVYDPEKWAVVFKYSSINIPAGVTVTFKNHAPNAPVVWLVNGDVTIAGSVNLAGEANYYKGTNPEGGPGGFRAGIGYSEQGVAGEGLGPGGGNQAAPYGNYADPSLGSPVYGNKMIVPLLGGSGGAGQGHDGGGGGGAILIAATGNITANGSIDASGAYGAQGLGSGGGIRLIADTISGTGSVNATGVGFLGRIRMEANHPSFAGSSVPGNGNPTQFSVAVPADPPIIWAPVSYPSVQITAVGTQNPGADPRASFAFLAQDVNLPSTAPVTITLHATNVPVDGTWLVGVRVVPLAGADTPAASNLATLVGGDATSSVWQITGFTPKQGASALQARAWKQ